MYKNILTTLCPCDLKPPTILAGGLGLWTTDKFNLPSSSLVVRQKPVLVT